MELGEGDEWLCRTCLGLTIYLPDAPYAADVVAAFEAYRAICPTDKMGFIKAARSEYWDDFQNQYDDKSLMPYLAAQDERRDQGIKVWDGEVRESWSFTMQGVWEPELPPCAAFCQVLFPQDVDRVAMQRLALDLADRIPFLSGHAGYTCVFDPWRKDDAFDYIYAWSRRYRGLEVEDLNKTLPTVLDSVKGANWLTLLGSTLVDRLPNASAANFDLAPSVVTAHRKHGWVIRAGDAPTLADRNRREFPDAYAAVENVLLPLKVKSHPEFEGRFSEEGATMAWLNRLTKPEGW